MSGDELLGRLLLDVALVILVARGAGLLLARLRQPPVLGEILAGIALGPTILGAFPGDPSAKLFPAEVQQALSAVGVIGLVLFMFIIGLELDLRAIRRHQRAVVNVSVGSVGLPSRMAR